MKDTTRMIIAFAAIMILLFAWQLLTPKRSSNQVVTKSPETTNIQPSTQTPQQPIPSKKPTTQKPTQTETEATLENRCVKITFSSYGGTIKSVYLKKYRAELVPQGSLILQTVIPLQIAPDSRAESLSGIQNWQIIDQDDSTIIFQGLLKKTYRLHKDYSLSLIIETTTPASPPYQITYESGLALTEVNKKDELNHFSLFYQNSQKTNKVKAHKLHPTTESGIKWTGLKSKYFTAILSCASAEATINIVPLADSRISYTYLPANNTNNDYLLYFGPLDYDILKSYKIGWEALNELGWTKIFSIAILTFLKFLYRLFKNYGIVIIIFSTVMKLVFYPLTRMSNKQMLQMQMLQPKMAELKKKYKNDAQGLNRETMQLYKLYKISPFSGCLPLVFQMPIFWALYAVLQKTIELRHASFVFWLKDLSLKDPIYILPILMGVSFLIQNFLTSADKRNMALLIFMPIFLTVIFLNFPSGLQLYWLFFNLLSIVESVIARGGLKWKTQKISTPTKQEV